ncbi:hypothetical protein B5X24_HaOG200623 [Helicoverpa armigera]|nr:hypothetical protein B5X24_HaOG200623 [Helicoverpa armigera]
MEYGLDAKISKELESINFRVLQETQLDDEAKKRSTKPWIEEDNKLVGKRRIDVKDQFTAFQKAMKVLLVWGQTIGLNPVTGILQKDPSKMRFTVYTWKFLFSLTVAVAQTIGTTLCIYKLFREPTSISALGFVTFFTSTCFTTFLFILIASKWPTLMQDIVRSKLDEYVDKKIITKCRITCCIFIGMALMEHFLSILSRVARVIECSQNETDHGEVFVKVTSPWLYDLNVPYVVAVAVMVQYVNLITTANWNYSYIFIVCVSMYLSSILNQINKRIALEAQKTHVPAKIWINLREDYTRATHLVKRFDDVISGIVLVTYANDLFFICLQLYNVLSNMSKAAQLVNKLCPDQDGTFRAYSYPAYLIYSVLYLLVRFLTVSIVASGVNTASLLPAPILYGIPTTAYTKEVERFQNQVNGDVVALSGLHFFYITRDLVLTLQN